VHFISHRTNRPALTAVLGLVSMLLIGTPTVFAASEKPQSAAPPAPKAQADKATKPKTETPDDRLAEGHDTLEKLNIALEGLAGKVSPAVVQILVTGYGSLNEGDHSKTAFIVRQHAVGSGVIVDPNGYIITNAHV